MRSLLLSLVLLALLLVGCARLPPITPLTAPETMTCPVVYVRDAWQFVHIIEATPPGRTTTTLMGAVEVTPDEDRLHCALMTLEGLVLFEADGGRQVNILRALPPFDKPGFTHGLIEDIRLMFLAPETVSMVCGRLAEGRAVCRYRLADNQTRDLLTTEDHGWELRAYNKDGTLRRTLIADGSGAENAATRIPKHLTLIAHGMLGYELNLTLVEALPLTPAIPHNEAFHED